MKFWQNKVTVDALIGGKYLSDPKVDKSRKHAAVLSGLYANADWTLIFVEQKLQQPLLREPN
jgi:hypothetical protein